MEVRRRLALRHVAGPVDPDEEEGHAPRIGPLQCAQPVAHHLEAGAEVPGQQFDVVAQRLGLRQKTAVRQQQRTGEVVGQADARQRPGGRVGEARGGGQPIDHRAHLQQCELGRHLEGVLARFQVQRHLQQPPRRVEAPVQHRAAVGVHAGLGRWCGADDAHAVALLQRPLQARLGCTQRQSQRSRHRLGGPVEFVEMVVAGEEEVAHLFVGQRLRIGRPVAGRIAVFAQLGTHHVEPGLRVAQPAVQRHHVAADRGHVGGQLAHLGQGDRIGGGAVGQRLAQAGEHQRLFVFREGVDVDSERRVQLQQHRHGERPLVVLQLVEVAGRERQRLGQGLLVHAALFPQPAQAHAHEPLLRSVAHRAFLFVAP